MRLKTIALSLLTLLAAGVAFADNIAGPAGRFISVGGSIDLLGDVNSAGKANGNCLVYNTSLGKWVPGVCGSGGSGASSLSVKVGGVQISSPTSVLNFSSSTFDVSQGPVGTSTVTLNFSSVTAVGNVFNTANKLLLLDATGKVSNSLLSSQVSLFGDAVDLASQTNGNYVQSATAGPGLSISPSSPGHGTQPIFSLAPGTLAGDQSWADGTANSVTWRWVVPGVAPRFTFSDNLIQTLSQFDAPTFLGTTMTADTISAGLSMTSQGKNVAQYSDTVIAGSTVAYSSGTIQNINVTTITFANGTTMTTAATGGAGGFWVGTATSVLNMNGFAVTGSTLVATSSFSVTGATETIFGTTYVRASSATVGSGQKLLVYTAAAGKMTESIQDIITNGMTTTSTDTKSGALILNSSFTLPSVTQTGNPASAGQLAYSTSTAGPNWGGTVVYDGKQRMNAVMTATDSVPLAGWVPTYDATGRVLWEAQSGSGGVGTPGGSNTQIQFNNAGSFNGVAVATYNATTQLLTYSSGSVHLNVSSETFHNANIAMTGTSAIYWADGTVQTSSPIAGGGSGTITGVTAGYGLTGGGTSGGVTLNLANNSTSYIQKSNTLQSGATFYVSSGTATNFIANSISIGTSTTSKPLYVKGLSNEVFFESTGAGFGGETGILYFQPYENSFDNTARIYSYPQSAVLKKSLLIQTQDAASPTTYDFLKLYPSGGVALTVGTNASTLLSLAESGALTVSGLTYPTADGSTGQFMKTDGSGNLSFSSIANSGVTAGSYGTASNVSSFTVAADGRITGAANVAILITPTQAGLANVTNNAQINNQSTLQSGSTGYPDFLYVGTSETVHGALKADGQITSSNTVITTAAGLLDATKLTGNLPALNGSALTNLTGSNVGSGVPAANIASGSLGNQVIASSIATSGVTAGTYGNATNVSSITIGADGRVTSAANVAIAISGNAVSGGTFGAVNGSGLTHITAANIDAGSLGNTVQVSSLAAVVAAGSYGSATVSPTITFNAQGQIIGASSNTIAAGGAQDFDLKDSTGSFNRLVDHSTNPIINVSSISFSGTYDSGGKSWAVRPSTYSHVPGGSTGAVTFTGSSSHTVEGLQFWAVANSTFTGRFVLSLNSSSSNAGGFKFLMTGPASPVVFEMTGGGSGASATTANLSQQAAALNTKTQTLIGTYSSGAQWFEFEFQLITGSTAGYVNVQLLPTSGAGTNSINSESYITAVMD